jgi:hypothetical protein
MDDRLDGSLGSLQPDDDRAPERERRPELLGDAVEDLLDVRRNAGGSQRQPVEDTQLAREPAIHALCVVVALVTRSGWRPVADVRPAA